MNDDTNKNCCPFCQNENTAPYLVTKPFRKLNSSLNFQLIQCNNCKVIYLEKDTLKDNLDLYSDDYHCYHRLQTKNKLIQYMVHFGLKNRIKIVLQFKKSGNLLDIGCATGEFLNELNFKSDWNLYGIEPNLSARNYAASIGNLTIFSDLEKANFNDNFFDVITLWDVIEHIDNPTKLMQQVNRIIKKEGVLIIKTPNPFSAEANLFKEYWSGLETPWHIFLYPENTLINFLINNDYIDIKFHNPNVDHNTFFRSITNFLTYKNHKFLLSLTSLLFYRYPFKLFFNLLLRIVRKFNFNSSITISAIRNK